MDEREKQILKALLNVVQEEVYHRFNYEVRDEDFYDVAHELFSKLLKGANDGSQTRIGY